MREGEWTKLVCEQLHARVIPYVASKRQPAGVPDRIIWSPLWQGFVEFKNNKTVTSVLQRRVMSQLNAINPGSAFIWRRVEDSIVAVEYCTGVDIVPLDHVPVSQLLAFCGAFKHAS